MPRKKHRKKGRNKRNSNQKAKRTQVIHKSLQSPQQEKLVATSLCDRSKTTSYTHAHYIKLPTDLEDAFFARKNQLENESKLDELTNNRQQSVNEHTSQSSKINEKFETLQNKFQNCDAAAISHAKKKLSVLREKLKYQTKQTKLCQIMIMYFIHMIGELVKQKILQIK